MMQGLRQLSGGASRATCTHAVSRRATSDCIMDPLSRQVSEEGKRASLGPSVYASAVPVDGFLMQEAARVACRGDEAHERQKPERESSKRIKQ